MWNMLIYAMLAVIAGGAFAFQHLKLNGTEEHAAQLEAENQQLKKDLSYWLAAYERAQAAQEALSAQAKSCLERERKALADAEEWRGLLESMKTRPLNEKEANEVPDDATRRRLLDDLDRPL